MSKGRPKLSHEKSNARKKQFIDIAKRLFLNEGYQSVSMRKIAAEAGVSPMTLYQSFDNKRDMLRYIWTDIFIEVKRQCELAVNESNDKRSQLFGFCETFLEYWLTHPEHYRVVYMESDQLEGNGDEYFVKNEVVTNLFAQLESLVKALATDNTDLDIKVRLLILQLQGIAHGIITISEMPWGEPKSLLHHCLSAFEQSIHAKPA